MLIVIPNVLSGEALQQARALLRDAPWGDGRATAGDAMDEFRGNVW